jgi:hypothetical protein
LIPFGVVMREIDGRIVWAPRVSRKKIRHLYKSEARGVLDERLTAEIAYALLDRCGWSMTWGDYLSSYQGRQLTLGGAGPWVQEYVDGFRAANTARKQMLLIDRLLHQFHWALKHPDRGDGPKGPTRPLAVNFLSGNMRSALEFLDELSTLGEPDDPTRAAIRAEYRQNREASRSIWRPHMEDKP